MPFSLVGTALVTGASSGIGEAFARALAREGMDVVLVARSADRLEALADELRSRVRAEPITMDLVKPGAAERLLTGLEERGTGIDLLVNNAGFGVTGPFLDVDPERDREMVRLNVEALVDLTHAFLPSMLARRRGAVVNVASTAAFQPVPSMAVYAATKAFVLSFTEALAVELEGNDIRMLALCPGPTNTRFGGTAGMKGSVFGKERTPEEVVATALRAIQGNQTVAIDGLVNHLRAFGVRFGPRGMVARMAGRAMRGLY